MMGKYKAEQSGLENFECDSHKLDNSARRPLIRMMEQKDILGVARLEQECFSVPWSEQLLEDCLGNIFDHLWVLEAESAIVAYCNFRIIAGEGELMRIAVAKAFRGCGYARNLMEILVGHARENQVSAITLEVRSSNLSAINLYKAYDFQIEAVRRNYYTNPTEDALIMWRRLV